MYDVRVITERGNVLVPSGSPIYAQSYGPLVQPTNFTNSLTVTLLNMTAGRIYTLRLTGNIPGGEIIYTYMATRYNETVSLAFGVNPGTYELTVSDGASYYQALHVSIPEVRHITIPIPKASPSSGVEVIANIPPIVTCNSNLCKPSTEQFFIQAIAINTGNSRICNLQFTLSISHVRGVGSHFSSITPSTLVPPQGCLEPGGVAGPVSWIIRPSGRARHIDEVSITFVGKDPFGGVVSANLAQRIATVRGE